MRKYIAICVLICATSLMAQKFNNLAPTPPMGWNSWNTFACDVNETLIKQMADKMVSSGMKDAGYIYVNIDDCWHGERDSLGFIHPDPERFASGMKALAEYIHSLGLKFGIYSDAGWQTCGGKPGSRGYEYQDALQYAKWGVDYLKYDWCNTEALNQKGAYLTMRDALYKAGRPIVFSICEWGNSKPWTWGKDIGHLWRTTGDIINCFDCVVDHGTWKSNGIMEILDMQEGLRIYNGPNHWNDPDMMEVGNGMTVGEDKAHFSMWCMLAAPLIAGNDLRNMTEYTRTILTNKEVIAVDQDTLGIQGYKFISEDGLETWLRPLSGGDWAVCFMNRSDVTRNVEHDWTKEYVQDGFSNRIMDCKKDVYTIRDLWKHKEAGNTTKNFITQVPSHDVVMLRLTLVN